MKSVGERFTLNGKLYEVTDVWGEEYGFKEVTEELPVFEEPKNEEIEETPTFEEEVEEVIEAPKKRGRRKKA